MKQFYQQVVAFRKAYYMMLLLLAGTFSTFAQIISEVEPNNTVTNAVASLQSRIYQPSIISGTISSGDDDYWLIGYDFSMNFGGDNRWWVFFDGDIPAGITVERGVIGNPTGVYAGTESTFFAPPFSECAAFEYTSSFTGAYTYLRIRSTNPTPTVYSIGITERPPAADACGFPGEPRENVIVPCNAPTISALSGTTRTSATSLQLNSFPAVSDADGYIVQISDNNTFVHLFDQYDEAYTGTPNTVFGGSGNQVVANLTSPGIVNVSGLSQGTNYTFKVTPYTNCLSLHKMGTGTTTTPSQTCGVTPSAPTSVTAISPSSTSITLQSIGAASSGATGYITYLNDTNTFIAPTAIPTTSTTYNGTGQQAIYAGNTTAPNTTISGTGIISGNTYYIKSYSYETCGGINYIETTGVSTSLTICAGAPTSPTALSLTNASHSSINLSSVSNVVDADGYIVLMNTTNSFTNPADGVLPSANTVYAGSGEQVVYVGTSSTINTLITNLDNSNGGVTYYFKAFAYRNCAGSGNFESTGVEANATTLGAVQTIASDAIFFEVGDTFMDFKSFTSAAGATGHIIKMNTTNSFTTPVDGSGSLPGTSTTYGGGEQVIYAGTSVLPNIRISGLSASTTYYFTIYTYSTIDGAIFYNTAAYAFSQQNIKPSPTLTFDDIIKTYGDAAFNANASTNSAGDLTYSLVSQTNGGSAVSTNGTVTVGNSGTVTIQVDQAANANYNPGTAQATMTINKADPIIQFDPVSVSLGAPDQILSATAQIVGSGASASTGTISYTIQGSAPNGNTLSGANNSIWTVGDGGTFTIRASITEDANYTMNTKDALFTVIAPAPALHFEQAINFTEYDYLSVPDDNSLDFTNHFTYEAWVNFDQLNVLNAGFGWRALFAKSRYTDSYGLMVYAGNKTMRFYHPGFGAGFTDYIWSSLTSGNWHHVAVKLDGTNDKASILIDGVEVAFSTGVGALSANTEPLLIGASRNANSDPYPFDGAMDDVRFWNVARTDAEINDYKNVELQGSEEGLVLYYNFNEGTINSDNTGITQVPDQSIAGNHATFNRFALTGTTSNYVDGSEIGFVTRVPQTITFNALTDKTFGDTTFDLTATSSSGLPIRYESSDTSIATISGNTVTIVGAGSITITAIQTGDPSYLPAPNAVQSLTVNKASQVITFDALADVAFGDADFDLAATGGASGNTVTFVSSDTNVVTISGNTVTIVGTGTVSITASQIGNANYDAAADVVQSLTINAGMIVMTPKIYLQGTFTNPNTGEETLMRDDLRIAGMIPTTSPYADGLTIDAAVLNTTGTNAIVDWIWVELRDAGDASVIIEGKSALLQRDGDIVDTDAVSPFSFVQQADDYYIAFKHRNHLSVLSANTYSLSSMNTVVDLSASVTSLQGGSNAVIDMGSGIFSIPVGDQDENGQVQNADINAVIQLLGGSGYNKADMDMNGQIQNSDVNTLMNPNLGKGEQF
ncbi:LamG domain-containing protein [Aquimarina sp. MMG016]|uniref:LamG domain-containing protein n=1 Tax=Aquimarina sp. MMG016 TaxID=2822690 RepID=UPI001B3A0AC8|nr:LamG domain-containing protein [Aquimarina sp. MMG016]MBQ4820608.1 LamG domain-containing protein [Aquimarina sp. MMG016]